MKLFKSFVSFALLVVMGTGCSSLPTSIALTPLSDLSAIPKRNRPLSDLELKHWPLLDPIVDSVPGMSVDRAYKEILHKLPLPKNKVVVAVIDSGVDIEHEDLKAAIWTNPKEIAENGLDDDGNGYADDVHGWNFLGDMLYANHEFIRIIRGDFDDKGQYSRALQAEKESRASISERFSIYGAFLPFREHELLTIHFGKSDYTLDDLESITENSHTGLREAKVKMVDAFKTGAIKTLLKVPKMQRVMEDYYMNPFYDGRALVGDDPNNIEDIHYGNNDVIGDKGHATHGTHVSGIIAQKRHQALGSTGIASEVVQLMPIRAVPDGDEYDKDIALSIRYAVDNGAQIINGSFGKNFEQNSAWVRDAIRYAADHDVLVIMASGNDGIDLDSESAPPFFPNDVNEQGVEISNNFMKVGAVGASLGEDMLALFSNYGKKTVDVMAPGLQIYATTPDNSYQFLSGTSMAAPNATGVAALVKAYFPHLSAVQLKQILMDSGLTSSIEVKTSTGLKPFSELSKSGKIINAYNALLEAQKVSKVSK